MRVALDTSVLVAAFLRPHPKHAPAAAWLQQIAAGTVEAIAAGHALAECYAVLTRIPMPQPPTAVQARQILLGAPRALRWVPPTTDLYHAAIARCAERGLRSGAIFDALHVVTAEQEQADRVLTFNVGDFVRLSLDGGPEVIAPGLEPRAGV